MDIVGKARRLEAVLAGTMDRAAERVRTIGPRDPLEIVVAIVDAVVEEVQPAGRGRYVFPFNRVKVSLAAASKATRARLEAIIDETPTLRDRIVSRLESSNCAVTDLEVKTVYVAKAGAGWADADFDVELTRVAEMRTNVVAAPSQAVADGVQLSVEHGTAEQSSYTFVAFRVDPGAAGKCATAAAA